MTGPPTVVCMATTQRSTIECPQRVVDRQAQLAQLEQTEEYYWDLFDPQDPETLACAFEARRIHLIRRNLMQH